MRNVTRVPDGNDAEQPGRQSIPAGSLVTRVPEGCSIPTVSVCGPGCGTRCPNAAATSVRGLVDPQRARPRSRRRAGPVSVPCREAPVGGRRGGQSHARRVRNFRSASPACGSAVEARTAGDGSRPSDREHQQSRRAYEPGPNGCGSVERDVADRRDPDARSLPAVEEEVRIRFRGQPEDGPTAIARRAAPGHWIRPSDVVTWPPLATATRRRGRCSEPALAPPATASSARATSAPHPSVRSMRPAEAYDDRYGARSACESPFGEIASAPARGRGRGRTGLVA